jgi:hypothetical protein
MLLTKSSSYNYGKFTDVTITCSPFTFKAHALVIVMRDGQTEVVLLWET